MRHRLPLAVAISVLGCGGGGSAGGAAVPPPSAKHALLEHPMPQFKRDTLDGKAVDTAALGGHEVVVKFFAEYCEPCKRTLPAAEEIHRSHPEVVFIGVSEDESSDVAQRVVDQYRLTFPVVIDRTHVLAGRFRVTDMPVTFVADSRTTIRWVGDERQTPEDISRAVDAYR